MATTKTQWQVLSAQTLELQIGISQQSGIEVVITEGFWQGFKKRRIGLKDALVPLCTKRCQIRFVDGVVIDKQTTPHDIKQHVGRMVVSTQRIARHLYTICRTHQTLKILRTDLDVFGNERRNVGVSLNQSGRVSNSSGALIHVSHNTPAPLITLG